VEAVKSQLQGQNEEMTREIDDLRIQIDALKASIASMKSKLYTKFGDSIQLEYD
jgi:chaperonin cofactor prefoldin